MKVKKIPTVREWAEYWFHERYVLGHMARRKATLEHQDGVRGHLDHHILPVIGGMRIDVVDVNACRRVIEKMTTGNATKNRVRTTMCAMFKDATLYGMAGWRLDRSPVTSLPKLREVREPRDAPTPEEMVRLLECLDGLECRGPLALMLTLGMRLEEAASLRYQEIELSDRVKGAAGVLLLPERRTKEKRPKSTPIPLPLVPFLPTADECQGKIGRVWPRASRYCVVRDLEVACLRAGIERHITPHGLRHGWAQLAYTRNVALDRIQKILGHSSLLVTAAYIEKARGLDMKAATLSALWG